MLQTLLSSQATLVASILFVLYISSISPIILADNQSDQSRISLDLQDSVVLNEDSLYKMSSNMKESSQVISLSSRQRRSINPNSQTQTQMVDSCQSKMEIITPYYATNSKGKLRTILNSELMQQAIQVETCAR